MSAIGKTVSWRSESSTWKAGCTDIKNTSLRQSPVVTEGGHISLMYLTPPVFFKYLDSMTNKSLAEMSLEWSHLCWKATPNRSLNYHHIHAQKRWPRSQNFSLIFIRCSGEAKTTRFFATNLSGPRERHYLDGPCLPSSGRGSFLPSIVFTSCYLLRQGRKAGTWSQGHAPHFGIVGTLTEVLRPPLPAGIV